MVRTQPRNPTPASCFDGADPLSIAHATPPADFPEGGHPYRDRCPVSDFFTQGQKIGEAAHATARGDDPECAGTSFIQVCF
jgi:hypothetical protein